MLWRDNHFLPGPSDAFHSYFNGNKENIWAAFYSNSYDTFLWSGYWQQFEKRLQQQDSLLRSTVVEATTQTQASWAKTARPIRGENHALLESGESRTCSVAKNLRRVKLLNEINWTINARDVLFSVNRVTYMSISEVLDKTCWSSATIAKIWNLLNFCRFFVRQKLEINKIGSSATRPLGYILMCTMTYDTRNVRREKSYCPRCGLLLPWFLR